MAGKNITTTKFGIGAPKRALMAPKVSNFKIFVFRDRELKFSGFTVRWQGRTLQQQNLGLGHPKGHLWPLKCQNFKIFVFRHRELKISGFAVL